MILSLGLTNGTTIVTINTNRRTGMEFDGIINSDIVGAYKPNPKMYQTAMKALGVGGVEVAMVAAHAYDLEAARKWCVLVFQHVHPGHFPKNRLLND